MNNKKTPTTPTTTTERTTIASFEGIATQILKEENIDISKDDNNRSAAAIEAQQLWISTKLSLFHMKMEIPKQNFVGDIVPPPTPKPTKTKTKTTTAKTKTPTRV